MPGTVERSLGRFTNGASPLQARVQGTLLLDPTRSEEAQEEAGLLLTFLPNLNQASPGEAAGMGGGRARAGRGARRRLRRLDCAAPQPGQTFAPSLHDVPSTPAWQVSSLTCRGHWTRDQLQDAVELAMGGCEQIDEAMRSKLTECAPGPGAGVGEAAVPAAR